jgi:prophage DNA circulation protein
MTNQIEKTAQAIDAFVTQKIESLRQVDNEQLNELLHECKDAAIRQEWTARAASEILNAAATIVLEERGIVVLQKEPNQ